MNRTCSLPSVLAFIRLKFRPWRGFWCFGRYLLVLAPTALKLGVRACKRSYRSVYGLGCRSHTFVGGVRVYVQCGFYAFVSYRAGECFDIHSVPQSLRCEGVAKCVERHLLTSCVFENLRELLSARTRIARQVLFSFIRRWEQPL